MIDKSATRQLLHNQAETFGAVVLAGGLARRMGGQDKGLVCLAGSAMISYTLRSIIPLVDRCVVNANRNKAAYEQIAASTISMLDKKTPNLGNVAVVADKIQGHLGPLAGLSAGIDSLGTDYVFMCPCDSPFIQGELLDVLLQSCMENDADVAVAHDGNRLQPVFCVVNKRVKASLDLFLHGGQRKIDRWFETQKYCEVPCMDYAASFVNINTNEEREEAERVLSR
jgi:molybdopterin-guanine dinucleotide biosynthesis protein A